MTAAELRKAERAYRRSAQRTEQLRQARTMLVRRALAEGWTYRAIGEVTGLSHQRIGQIKVSTDA